ncbi:SPOR domain-containing protein [Methylotuvimicrobium sp. KM2]|uniref:SPOR domain-containing protein n=1 Tax=Methylotuvimicrobium sp. KM2 TaxID=3133976 RepID=UPI003101AA06
MADSEDKKKSVSPKNFADDLDSMLDDAASSIDSDELMNDDDAIDKLLMDSAFDEQDLSDDEDEFGELFAEDSTVGDQLTDDLDADNDLSGGKADFAQDLEPSNSSEDSAMAEIDEFSDIGFDEFAETEPEPIPVSSPPEEKTETDFDSDDFTLAEFDISAPEDDVDEFAKTQDENIALEEEEENPRVMEDPEELEQEPDPAEPDFAVYDDASAFPEVMTAEEPHKTVVDDVITTQISQLFSEQEILKQQLGAMSASTSQGQADEIDRLSKMQNQLKKQLDKGAKIPTITYVAMATAVVALLTAGVFAYLVLQSDNEIESLTELIGTLEENQTELNALLIKNNMPEVAQTSPAPMASQDASIEGDKTEIIPLTPKLTETEANGTVSSEAQLAQSASKTEATPTDTEKKIEQEEGSPPVSDVTNETGQVAALEARIKELETKLAKATAPPVKKAASKSSAPIKRSPPKSKAPSAGWSVNLISFKQDWYANRKAAEFSKQGVPAKVIPVQVKGQTWYRLSVSGFKSRDEASAYAARVKKTHNLDSVWIARD